MIASEIRIHIKEEKINYVYSHKRRFLLNFAFCFAETSPRDIGSMTEIWNSGRIIVAFWSNLLVEILGFAPPSGLLHPAKWMSPPSSKMDVLLLNRLKLWGHSMLKYSMWTCTICWWWSLVENKRKKQTDQRHSLPITV